MLLPPGRFPVADELDEEEYSFAVEYDGPPLPYAVPQAIPIEMDHIPVADVLSEPDLVAFPIVQPIPSPLVQIRRSSKKDDDGIVREKTVSPTFVIGYDGIGADGVVEVSGEIVSSCGGLDGSSNPSSEFKESVDFSVDTNQLPHRVSTESVLSSEFGFCSEQEKEEEEYVDEKVVSPERNLRRPALVTFQESCGTSPRSENFHNTRVEESGDEKKLKKGSCYRCFKGNWFTEKEVCIVCNAKYCSNCVLRAMGSMPEGRKCVSCIGYPIEEEKRERLGKCSRMLKKLLTPLEIEQIMKAEKYCEENQLRSEYVSVNGKPLSSEEMIMLMTCAKPPSKLKPGHYWYDKVSGLWGKEGHKPHKIISPNLKVGGCLMENASNGNTGIFINGREITKAEMRMLQLVGVQCAGNPHFWVNADGTYQEEGHKIIKGNLWDKPGMKLVCSVLSLPLPGKVNDPSGEEANYMSNRAAPDYLEQRPPQKLLLIGYHQSGTSTLFKQAKFLYNSIPFSVEEREHIKVMIQGNIYHILAILLEGRERFEEECLAERRKSSLQKNELSGDDSDQNDKKTIYSLSPKLKSFSDFLLKVRASGDLLVIFLAAAREYAPLVEELWNDASIQATFSRRKELQSLPDTASYFLERATDISRSEYEPSNMDILYADGSASSSGLAYTEFLLPNTLDIDNDSQPETVTRYQLVRVHPQGLGKNRKCLEMFENARMVIFCVALSDYDEYLEDSSGTPFNKMSASKKLFEDIVTHPTFEHMDFLLILNKFDQLEQKIERAPLTLCDWFSDFHPVTSHSQPNNNINHSIRNRNHSSPAEQAFYYVAIQFKRLFTSLTGRKLYVTMANALDQDSVDHAIRYAKEIMNWEDERIVFGASEFSIYSTEANSYSD